MSVFEIDPLHDRRWQSLIEDHPDSSVFHRREWLQALKRTYGYEPFAVSSCSPDSPLINAILLCRVRSLLTGNRLVSLPFSDHCEPLGSIDEVESLMAGLKAEVDWRRWRYIEIRPIRAIPGLQNILRVSSDYYFHRVDLRRSEEELLRSFHKDCIQRKIRRAERESLRYQQGTSETLLNQFYKLLVLTRRRQELPPQPMEWFRSLAAIFGRDLTVRVAYKDEIPIASIMTLSHKKVMTYKYGCSDARFHNLGGSVLLMWRAIQEAQASGFEALDMGRSEMDNPGLVSFKDHWGAQKSTLAYWRYPLANGSRQTRWTMRIVKRVVPVLPDKTLTIAGSVLYRHIG